MSSVNLQHDCHRGQCDTSGTQILHQEREATTRHRNIVKHADNIHFIVNTHSLHNYRYIARAIPLHLRGTSFKVADPVGLRKQAASLLRDKKQQQTEARKANSMAIAMGRAQAPSGVPDITPGDEDIALASGTRAEANGAPFEPHMEAPNDDTRLQHLPSDTLPDHHLELREEVGNNSSAHSFVPLGISHDRTAESQPAPEHTDIAEHPPQAYFPSGHPIFLQPSANANAPAQANLATAIPTTL